MVDLRIKGKIRNALTNVVWHADGTNHHPKAGNAFLKLIGIAGDFNSLNEADNTDVANPDGTNPIAAVTKVRLEMSEAELRKVWRLLVLKRILADVGGTAPAYANAVVNDEKGEWNVIIRKVSNTAATGITAATGVDGLSMSGDHTTLYVGNKVEFDDIDIDVRDNVATHAPDLLGTTAAEKAKNDLSAWKEGLENLETLLSAGYDYHKDLSAIKSSLAYLKGCVDGNALTAINTISAETNIDKKINQTLYWLSTDGTNRDYKLLIDDKIEILEELVFWHEELSFATIDEVLKANANGFTIKKRKVGANASTIDETIGSKTGGNWDSEFVGGRDGAKSGDLTNNDNKTAIKKVLSGKKYRGFDIIDSNQREKTPAQIADIVHNAATDLTANRVNVNEVLLGKAFHLSIANGSKKDAIDTFRTVFYDTSKSKKEDFRGFSVEEARFFANITKATQDKDAAKAEWAGVDIMDKTFEIKGRLDGKKIDTTNKADDTYKNDDFKFTKVIYDVTAVANKDAVLNLLYTTDFDTTIGTKKKVLDMLFVAIQDNAWTGKITNTNFNYQAASDNDRTEITKAYNSMKNFLTVYDIDYSGYDDSKSTELLDAYKKLEEFRDATSGDKHINRGNVWTSMINKKMSETVTARDKKAPIPGPQGDITAADITKKVGELNLTSSADEKELIKKMFDNTTEIIKGKKALLDKLVELAKKIDEAFKDGSKVSKDDLNAFKNDKTNKGAEAWALAEAVKDTKSGKTLTALVLEKAKGKPKQDELKVAKDAAKVAMKAKMATGGEDAYNIIIDKSTTLTSKALVDKTAEIFGKCYDAWGKTADDKTLREELAKYGDATSGDQQTVWTAINLFKKNDKNVDHNPGFATGALNHLRELVKGYQVIVTDSKIDKVENKSDADASIQELEKVKNTTTDPVLKKRLEDITIPRAKLISKLYEKNDDKSKELAKLIQNKFIVKIEDDYEPSTYATNLKDLEDNLTKLKEFKSGGKSTVYAGLGIDEKKTFDSLIESVGKKVEAMQAAKKVAEKSKDTPTTEPGFWNSWKGYTTIAAIALVVIGVAAYFLKANSSEEGGETE